MSDAAGSQKPLVGSARACSPDQAKLEPDAGQAVGKCPQLLTRPLADTREVLRLLAGLLHGSSAADLVMSDPSILLVVSKSSSSELSAVQCRSWCVRLCLPLVFQDLGALVELQGAMEAEGINQPGRILTAWPLLLSHPTEFRRRLELCVLLPTAADC